MALSKLSAARPQRRLMSSISQECSAGSRSVSMKTVRRVEHQLGESHRWPSNQKASHECTGGLAALWRNFQHRSQGKKAIPRAADSQPASTSVAAGP